jgi:hypothetical protein
MIRRLVPLALCGLALLSSVAYSVTAQVDLQPREKPDCSYVNGVCTNPNHQCGISPGHCTVGGHDGQDGWHDPGGDGCGCQI